MNKLKITLLFLTTIVTKLHADFTHISAWQRTAESGEKQLLIVCGDDHSIREKGFKQAQEVAAILKKDKNNALIIEDAYDYSRSINQLAKLSDGTENFVHLIEDFEHYQNVTLGSHVVEDVVDHMVSGIVLVSALALEQNSICERIEFRQLITFQLPHLLELIDEYGYDHRVVIQSLIEHMYNEIESFNDCPRLNEFYAHVLRSFSPLKKIIEDFMQTQHGMVTFPTYLCDQLMKNPDLIEADCLTYASPHPQLITMREKMHTLFKSLKTDIGSVDKKALTKQIEINFVYNAFSALFDAYLLHALYEKQIDVRNENIAIICAGLGHTMHVETLLPDMGYTKLHENAEKTGVNIADFCEPFVPANTSNPIMYVWSYVVDSVESVISYVSELFE